MLLILIFTFASFFRSISTTAPDNLQIAKEAIKKNNDKKLLEKLPLFDEGQQLNILDWIVDSCFAKTKALDALFNYPSFADWNNGLFKEVYSDNSTLVEKCLIDSDMNFLKHYAFRLACRLGLANSLRVLFTFGADPVLQNNFCMRAALHGHVKVMELLLAKPEIDPYDVLKDESIENTMKSSSFPEMLHILIQNTKQEKLDALEKLPWFVKLAKSLKVETKKSVSNIRFYTDVRSKSPVIILDYWSTDIFSMYITMKWESKDNNFFHATFKLDSKIYQTKPEDLPSACGESVVVGSQEIIRFNFGFILPFLFDIHPYPCLINVGISNIKPSAAIWSPTMLEIRMPQVTLAHEEFNGTRNINLTWSTPASGDIEQYLTASRITMKKDLIGYVLLFKEKVDDLNVTTSHDFQVLDEVIISEKQAVVSAPGGGYIYLGWKIFSTYSPVSYVLTGLEFAKINNSENEELKSLNEPINDLMVSPQNVSLDSDIQIAWKGENNCLLVAKIDDEIIELYYAMNQNVTFRVQELYKTVSFEPAMVSIGLSFNNFSIFTSVFIDYPKVTMTSVTVAPGTFILSWHVDVNTRLKGFVIFVKERLNGTVCKKPDYFIEIEFSTKAHNLTVSETGFVYLAWKVNDLFKLATEFCIVVNNSDAQIQNLNDSQTESNISSSSVVTILIISIAVLFSLIFILLIFMIQHRRNKYNRNFKKWQEKMMKNIINE